MPYLSASAVVIHLTLTLTKDVLFVQRADASRSRTDVSGECQETGYVRSSSAGSKGDSTVPPSLVNIVMYQFCTAQHDTNYTAR